MSVTIKTDNSNELINQLAETLAKNGVPEQAKRIYKGRNSVYSLKLADGSEVNIKAFKIPRGLNPYIYTLFRKSKARRSYENSLRLLEMNIRVPLPLGYVEVRKGINLTRSYYISRQIEADNMRDWEKKPNVESLLRALAKEIVRFHECGVLHKDFSPGNILYTGNQTDGYMFYYIDLNRMTFDVHNHRRLMTMFKAINLNPEETARIGRYYGEAAGIGADVAEKEAREALQTYFDKKSRKRRLKKLLHIDD